MPNLKTMKAAVVEKFGQPLVVREVPIPTPGQGQALVEVFASGVCHTDLHAVDGDWPVKPMMPLIPGHEGAGIVTALGPGVTHLKEGDRVGIAWLHSACGHCDYCLAGWETLCPQQQNSGYSVNGTFAQYALGQADYLGRIPKNLSFVDAAPILCAGVTTYKDLKETEARPGEWVAISGIGGLGHVAVQYASWRAPLAPMSRSMRSHLARHKGTAALCGLRPASSRRRSLMWYRSAPPSAASSSAPARTLPRCWRSPPRGTCARRFSGAAGGHQQHLRRHQGEQGRRADGGDDVTCARFRPSSFWCRPRNLPSSPRKRVSRWQVPPLRPLGSRFRGNDDRSGDEDRKGTDSVNSRQVPTSVARVGRPPSIRLPRRDGHGRLPRPRTRPQRCRRAGNRRPAPPVRRRSCAGHCGR